METMSAIFGFLMVIVCPILIIIGLIKPPLVIRWGNTKTRARVLITYGGALIACLISTMVTYELLPDDVKKLREEKQKIARIEAEAEKKAAEMLAAKKAEERQAKENLKDTKQSMNAEKSIQQAKTDARLDEIFYNDMKTFDKAYDDAPNEIKKSEVFRQARRYEQLFFAQFQYEVVNWKGKISELSTDKGGGYLRLEIDISDGKGLFGGFKITFKDGGISRSSNIYQQAGEFKEGECVFFSGIVSAEGDSMFESTTMSHPEYNIDFTALNKCN